MSFIVLLRFNLLQTIDYDGLSFIITTYQLKGFKMQTQTTESWKLTREEAADTFPGDEYDKMINRAAILGDITYAECHKRSRVKVSGDKEFWAKTRNDLNQEKKDAVKFARGDRTEINKMKSTEGFAQWRIKSMSTSAKAVINAAIKYHDDLLAIHKERVQEALDEGKDIPPEVLSDYPDLKHYTQNNCPQ